MYQARNAIINNFLHSEVPPGEDMLLQLHALPRQELVNELENALGWVMAQPNELQDLLLIQFHALFMLCELRSESSLPVLLKLLARDWEFLDAYFLDHPTETMWQDVMAMGSNNLPALFEYLQEDSEGQTGSWAITAGLTQIALHMPEKAHEVTDGLKDLFAYYHMHCPNLRLRDMHPALLTVIELSAFEVLDVVKQFYDNERVTEHALPWDELVAEVNNDTDAYVSWKSLAERYAHRSTPNIKEDREFNKLLGQMPKDPEEYEQWQAKLLELLEKQGITPELFNWYVKGESPCACGSGEKQKKCCGNPLDEAPGT